MFYIWKLAHYTTFILLLIVKLYVKKSKLNIFWYDVTYKDSTLFPIIESLLVIKLFGLLKKTLNKVKLLNELSLFILIQPKIE